MPTIITRYVNTNSTQGGNGTTSGSSGANRAYFKLTDAFTSESLNYPDLVASDVVLKFECEGRQDSYGAVYTMPNFNTDETRYLWVYVDPNKRGGARTGAFDTATGYYRIVATNPGILLFSGSASKNIVFEGVQFRDRTNNNTQMLRYVSESNNTSLKLIDCVFYTLQTNPTSAVRGVEMKFPATKSLQVINSTFFNGHTAIEFSNASGGTSSIYNNTFVNQDRCLLISGALQPSNIHIKNNIFKQKSGSVVTAYSASSGIQTATNITNDSSSPDGVAFRNQMVSFVEEGSLDFMLAANDTSSLNRGTNLSTDAIYSFNTDINGYSRSNGNAWDIGAFQRFRQEPTVITRYVNTAATTGGNGITNNTVGTDRAYKYLHEAYNAEYGGGSGSYVDLVRTNSILRFVCEGVAADNNGGNTTALSGKQFITDKSRYVHIYVDPRNRHSGSFDDTKYRIQGTGNYGLINSNPQYTVYEGIQVIFAATSLSSMISIADGIVELNNCILFNSSSNIGGSALTTTAIMQKTLKVVNNVFYGKYNPTIQFSWAGIGNFVAYNNVIYGVQSGFSVNNNESQLQCHIKNNIVQKLSGATSSSIITGSSGQYFIENNVVDDDKAPAGTNYLNSTASFVNTASLDFRLTDYDTVAKNRGQRLSFDAIYPFSYDITGQPRPKKFGAWDVGAHENPVGENRTTIGPVGNPFSITTTGNLVEGSE